MIDSLILFGQFFTKLNIPVPIDDATNKFKTSIQYITVFSFLLGCVEGLIFWGFTYLFPLWFAWILYWITDGLLTGGFHLDALADTADGFFSSRTADKVFAIMKDSRLGTMGSLALLYYYLLVIGLRIVISPYFNLLHMVLLTICLTMLTKTGLSLLFYKMVYPGNKKGLSNIWLGIKTWRIIVAQLFSVVIIGTCFSWQGLVSYAAIPLVAFFYRRKVTSVLGGTPGDTLGAFASLSPLIFLVILTIFNRQRKFYGTADVSIDAVGEKQASILAEKVIKLQPTLFVQTNLQRTGQTLRPLKEKRPAIPTIVLPDLAEKGFGDWEGLDADEIEAKYPQEWQRWLKAPLTFTPPTVEAFSDFKVRVHYGLRWLLGHTIESDVVMVVAHLGTLRLIYQELVDPQADFYSLNFKASCYSMLTLKNESVKYLV